MMKVLTFFTVVILGIVILACVTISELETAKKKDSMEFAVNQDVKIKIRNSRGFVKIYGSQEKKVKISYIITSRGSSQAKAERAMEEVDIDIRKSKSDVEINVDYPSHNEWFSFRDCYVKFIIKVPENATLDIDTSSGDVITKNINSDIKIDTSSGDVRLEECEGGILVDTSSGDVALDGVRGTVEIETSSGDISVKDTETTHLNLKSSSGDQKIRSSRIGELTSKASSGDIFLYGELTENGAIHASTSSGDVVFKLQEDLASRVNLSTRSGDMYMKYEHEELKQGKKTLECVISSEKALVEVKTSSGDITIAPYK